MCIKYVSQDDGSLIRTDLFFFYPHEEKNKQGGQR